MLTGKWECAALLFLAAALLGLFFLIWRGNSAGEMPAAGAEFVRGGVLNEGRRAA